MQALKALMRREATLVQRNSFLYIFKAVQVSDACIAGAHRRDIIHERRRVSVCQSMCPPYAVSLVCKMLLWNALDYTLVHD